MGGDSALLTQGKLCVNKSLFWRSVEPSTTVSSVPIDAQDRLVTGDVKDFSISPQFENLLEAFREVGQLKPFRDPYGFVGSAPLSGNVL